MLSDVKWVASDTGDSHDVVDTGIPVRSGNSLSGKGSVAKR